MLTRRIIPCLDVRDGRVVKGIRFTGLRDAGDPAELAARYEAQGADELTILDISATPQERRTAAETVARIRASLSIPLTVGGGVRTVDDVARLLEAGADKVAINTAAVTRPELVREAATRFGTQCIVIAIDAMQCDKSQADSPAKESWRIVVRSGAEPTVQCAVEWAGIAASLGAGEILLTSWDRDGTREGYDLPLTRAVASAVQIPVVASGGAAGPHHLEEALLAGADAVLAASIFHTGEFTIGDVKTFLRNQGLEMRT